ncbi:DNA helicase RecQ [Rhizophagus irregularis DAOM 181602=DAOM 197198]|nr:DNA helicase RecQ [Rhizophagus irregularis DAOM 181602=DAOM 197198]
MWKEYENMIMTYYNLCVYTASGQKLDENKITVSDAELEKVHDGLVAHLSDNHSFCWDEVCWRKENPDIQLKAPHLKEHTFNQREKFRQFLKECFYIPTKQSLITYIRISYNEAFNRVKLCFQDKKIDYWKTYSTRHALADFIPYRRNIQEKIKAKEFELTFAKHILDFEKIQKCLACKAFPKYSPLGLCRYHEFCFKYGWYQEFPNKQYIPPSQNLIANPPTSYDILVKMFGYQEFQDMQEIAISSYVNGKHTFISMHTGAGKTMCYWISAILRGGLTVLISPLVSLIDDQVIETIAARIGCTSIYTGKHQPPQYFEKVFSEIAIGLIKILYITAESFINNSSFIRMLLNFAKYAPVSFVIDEVHCIIKCKHFRESWSKLRKISTFFPSSSIMMLTGTCKESDAYLILENLRLASNDVAFIRGLSFSRPELTMKMHPKSTKEKTIGEIITLLKELNEGKCIIYCPTVRICDDVYEQLQEKSGLGLPMAVYYSSLDSNLIQETGRVRRDHNPAKCIIFYTCHDICTNYTIIIQSRESITEDMNDSFEANKRKEYLAKACEKIFEVVHFCEEQYICREQMLAEYFAWNGDNLSPPCAHCDNCLRVKFRI